jgi:hypothetical protein
LQSNTKANHLSINFDIMPRQKKSAADFRQEIADHIATFGDGCEERIRNVHRRWNTLNRKRSRGKELTPDETQFINSATTRADIKDGDKLANLEKKLRAAERKETAAIAATSVITIATPQPQL